ncbi:hypothetical protein GCM10010492_62380 [Saccharothrix mutabilis subsp. mutabilis]|uniref:DUF3558 domain-containing protein n=1 Tax=Saccharothrix mutabilis subsp. mutabilis TaxID=66855 RepID=A0ABN0UK66_9PSEU
MNRILRSVLAVGATAIALAACTSPNTGTPTPASTTGGGSTTTTKTSAKPSGPGALDLGKFASDPCTILTPAQLSPLGTFDPAEREDSPNGPGCAWIGTDVLKDSTYRIVLVTKGPTLESYRENSKSLKVFRDATVAGYPAISYDTASGTKDCTTVIGSSDKDAVVVQANIAPEDKANAGKPCDASEKLGATVVGILKG